MEIYNYLLKNLIKGISTKTIIIFRLMIH